MPHRNLTTPTTRLLFGLIVLFYLISGVAYLRTQSVTSDENSFYLYAKRFIKGHPERINPATDDSKTPIIVLNLLPRAVTQFFHPEMHKNDNGESDLVTARYVTLVFSILTLWLVFTWSTECLGTRAGLFAAFLMALEPNFLANAALVTTDAYSTFFLLAVLYSFWKLMRVRTWRWLILFSLALATAQMVKQSLFHLYLLLPVLLAVVLTGKPWPRAGTFLKSLLLFVFIQWLIINLGYYFFGSGTRIGDYHFFSRFFVSVQHHLPAGMPVPLPSPYVQSFDMTRYYDEIGGGYAGISGYGNITILGHAGRGHGFWYYYFAALFYKAPIPFMVLLLWAAVTTFRKTTIDRTTFISLLLPPVYFLVYFSFFYNSQIGVRHVIFLIPLLCVFLSHIVTATDSRAKRILLPLLSAYLLCSYLFYWQHQFSYTNEFITNKTFAYRYVGSANIDFRQGYRWAELYLKSHPEVQWATGKARPGRFLIPVQEYMDIYNEHKLDWLTSHTPYGQVAFSNLLIEVKPEDLPQRK